MGRKPVPFKGRNTWYTKDPQKQEIFDEYKGKNKLSDLMEELTDIAFPLYFSNGCEADFKEAKTKIGLGDKKKFFSELFAEKVKQKKKDEEALYKRYERFMENLRKNDLPIYNRYHAKQNLIAHAKKLSSRLDVDILFPNFEERYCSEKKVSLDGD